MRQPTYADVVRNEEPTEEEPAGQGVEEDRSQLDLAFTQEMEEVPETEARSSQEASVSAVSCSRSIPGNQEHWKSVKGKRKNTQEPSETPFETAGKKKVGGIPLSVNTFDILSDREEGEALDELPEEETTKDWSECASGSSVIGDTLDIIQAECLALSKGHSSQEQSSPDQDSTVEGGAECALAEEEKRKRGL
ncbi:UNVERIFIED_CONTAM: hypothetical protein FKN15_019500 [Acipenser sinensis]